MSEDKIDAGKIETDQIHIGGAGLRIGELAEFEPYPSATQHLLRAVAMLGIGALVHGWLIGPTFDVHNVWSWGYVIAWPVVLLGMVLTWVGGLVLGLLVIGLVAWATFWLWDWWAERSVIHRKTRELMAKAGAEQQKREAERREMAVTARAQAQRDADEQKIAPEEREEWIIRRTRFHFNQTAYGRAAAADAAQA